MAGEYWKTIESHRRELEIHEENERRKVLEEKLRIEEEARWREKEAKQRKEAEEKERQKILSQARSILLPMFQEIQANAPEVKQASKSRIVEESGRHLYQYCEKEKFVEMIKLQYGKFELTPEEKAFIERYPESKDGYVYDTTITIERSLIFFKRKKVKQIRRKLPLPEEIVNYDFSEVVIYYYEKNLFDIGSNKISNTVEFIQNPSIIIPNLVNQLKLPRVHSNVLRKGEDYLKPPPKPISDYYSYSKSDTSPDGHCCCS